MNKLINMNQFKAASRLAALALALHAPGAIAQVWDNGGPTVIVANQGGSLMSDTRQAQDFNVVTLSDITAVTFWSLELVPADYTGSITFEFLSNTGVNPNGSPGLTSLGSGSVTPTRTAAGTVLGYSQFKNDFNVSILNVPVGTYWLALHNGPLATTTYTDFYWSWTDPNATNTPSNRGQEFGLLPLAVAWTTNDQEHAFNLTITPVPEPGTWALLLAGLAVVAARRRAA